MRALALVSREVAPTAAIREVVHSEGPRRLVRQKRGQVAASIASIM